jgi:hypothetical protein
VSGRRRLGVRLQARGRRLRRWFLPARVTPPPEVLAILRALFPALDLGAVSFHRGLPHLLRRLDSSAVVVPALLARRRTRIYFAPAAWGFWDVDGLGTLVHEAYHALQAQEAGWGCGPLRPFLMLYFACGAANGFRYAGHPMENDAYGLAGRRWSRFETAFAGGGRIDAAAVARAGLVTPSSGLRFWRLFPSSVPLARWLLPLWLLAWTGAVALVWLGRLLVEGGGAAASALLGGIGAFVKSIEGFLYLND